MRSTSLDHGSIFFCQVEFNTVSNKLNFYILLCFQFWCCFLYTPSIYIYFELKKVISSFYNFKFCYTILQHCIGVTN
jgi:hypothetical protein